MKTAIAAVLLALLPVCAATVPQVSTADLPYPLPAPYHNSDPRADIAAALGRAKASGKLVLIDLGANWCPDCRMLAGVMAIPRVQHFIGRHYETVSVDVGRFNRNLDVPAQFGAPKPAGIPTVLIVTPDGRLLDSDQREALTNDRSMTPQAITDWLAQWVTAAPGR